MGMKHRAGRSLFCQSQTGMGWTPGGRGLSRGGGTGGGASAGGGAAAACGSRLPPGGGPRQRRPGGPAVRGDIAGQTAVAGRGAASAVSVPADAHGPSLSMKICAFPALLCFCCLGVKCCVWVGVVSLIFFFFCDVVYSTNNVYIKKTKAKQQNTKPTKKQPQTKRKPSQSHSVALIFPGDENAGTHMQQMLAILCATLLEVLRIWCWWGVRDRINHCLMHV